MAAMGEENPAMMQEQQIEQQQMEEQMEEQMEQQQMQQQQMQQQEMQLQQQMQMQMQMQPPMMNPMYSQMMPPGAGPGFMMIPPNMPQAGPQTWQLGGSRVVVSQGLVVVDTSGGWQNGGSFTVM